MKIRVCGLTGYLSTSSGSASDMRNTVRRMAAQLVHRGPDDYGEWVDSAIGIALGHRRLSVLDLSPAGHQPMTSRSERFVIAYNGEIYNYAEIRNELERSGAVTRWRGHSDTEVMLAAFETWGIEASLKKFNGMFALSLWDSAKRRLFLARDRFGEKPLYYSFRSDMCSFGSELKAMTVHPEWRGEIDRGALDLYMQFNYVPAPFTIYREARKLPAGTYIEIALDQKSNTLTISNPQSYWSQMAVAHQARGRPLTDIRAGKEELSHLLSQAIKSRMIADVPLGAFLSGGVDSSLVVALMQKQLARPVQTFTIGYDDPLYNESEHAQAVASHLGTHHTCHYVTHNEVRDAIVKVPSLYDEPFADSSQIPTYLVSAVARQQVTVALTGDGGDELFGGYHRYFVGQRVLQRMRSLPIWLRNIAASIIDTMPPSNWESVLTSLRRVLGRSAAGELTGERISKLAAMLRCNSTAEVYAKLMVRPERGAVMMGESRRLQSPFASTRWSKTLQDAEAMMLFDTENVLCDDFLVKVDRASMGVSLETRAPLLDPNLFEFAWRMPLSWKMGAQQGKLILRDVLYDHVPATLVDRPKQGFGIPIGSWLRGPLRDWAESRLSENSLVDSGFFNAQVIRKQWSEHVRGTHDRQSEVWAALVFQEWLSDQSRPKARAIEPMAQLA